MIKNGDLPAMPCGAIHNENGDRMHPIGYPGLTKREQFAMVIAQGLCACNQQSYIARDAVMLADELLDELERTK